MVGQAVASNVGDASCKRVSMISIAVARGRLGSAVRTQLTLRIEERTTSKSDALYVLPEPKIPCTQRVVWPACIPVRAARSSPGKCPFGARIQVPFQWPIIRMSHSGGGGTGTNAELFEVREGVIGVEVA